MYSENQLKSHVQAQRTSLWPLLSDLPKRCTIVHSNQEHPSPLPILPFFVTAYFMEVVTKSTVSYFQLARLFPSPFRLHAFFHVSSSVLNTKPWFSRRKQKLSEENFHKLPTWPPAPSSICTPSLYQPSFYGMKHLCTCLWSAPPQVPRSPASTLTQTLWLLCLPPLYLEPLINCF